ncbi:hypothetical protein G647_07517 [Cladophialophora carrionii CBS 160.54]|uniref:Uncharacterized protein n=1 Tax=Cladophialophora carrionii CBS 160.54 TaxID=1279043 RepID=V9D4F3_9EURO|nr:uncharacterized protein G647_07517 [Cladophialophora carrionii CBS 160.54]ETI21173.1 hypothetical protein G647_07517 [Cladophialophora carrionii CBS 160.54]
MWRIALRLTARPAFRDEDSDRRHIEKFHEDGLSNQLAAHLDAELKQDPLLWQVETRVRMLMGARGHEGHNLARSTAKRQLTNHPQKAEAGVAAPI